MDDYIENQGHVKEINQDIVLSKYIMFINGLGLFLSSSRGVRFLTQ